jgi:hypothetical protein
MKKSVQELLCRRLANRIALELIAPCAGGNKIHGKYAELRIVT